VATRRGVRYEREFTVHSFATDTAGAPTRAGPIRRFFNAWRRWEEFMDYSPYDYKPRIRSGPLLESNGLPASISKSR
jgi:hypothetical protein